MLPAFINLSSPTRKAQELHVLVSGTVLISVPKHDKQANAIWQEERFA